jgi:hypothetical protein
MRKLILLVCIFSCLSGTARAQEADVRRLVAEFITALQSLDRPAFRECWAENPVSYGSEDATRHDGSLFESNLRLNFQRLREAAAARGGHECTVLED